MSNQVPKPKIDNNALFAQRLTSNPPEYQIGDKVSYIHKLGDSIGQSGGIGFITGRVFNESETTWKYTVAIFGLKNVHTEQIKVLGKVE